MSETENKMLVRRMLAGEVDWLEQWASDAVWTIPGSTRWSGTYSEWEDSHRQEFTWAFDS
jgi:ketosteroid isomerase-like protein